MADEKKTDLQLDTLRDAIRESVRVFSGKLRAELGGNLESITIVGSSLTDDFRPDHSDINTVLVLKERTPDSLKVIAGIAKQMRRKRLAVPLLMTAEYVERSRDVFGIEFLDLQLTHKTVFGENPFASLRFDKKEVRLQCERELKAMLIRLRQGYIAAAGRKALVRDILISAAKGLTPLLRAMLWLEDSDRPARTEATFTKAAKEFEANIDAAATAVKWRYDNKRPSEGELENAFESMYETVDKLAHIVDELEV
jgi:hypothetical protein